MIGTLTAALAMLGTTGAATATVQAAPHVAVLGSAKFDTHDPYSVFEFSVHARGDGRSGTGVLWMSHHNDESVGWMVARVDCVRPVGARAVVTAVVSDAQDFAPAAPGDRVALTVRDNGVKDTLSVASREQVRTCHMSPEPEFPITRGDFRVLRLHPA
ncbi:hypothetical protein BU204_27175 [Actinophytocola xanthii]|uniref:Uncharacterized protein n=1 Tax=Actinophytocola xanthii TaxID=1912961 RepID=A0A1Q8CGF8_9PSEU|nr:hypothetical protein BU204_27175 [Actinophytocola xanthii]